MGLLTALAVGCASISNTTTRVDRKVVQSEPIVYSRRPVQLVPVVEDQWVAPDTMRASVDQEMECEDGYRNTVETTRVSTRTTKNVGTGVAVGTVLVVGGGLSLLAAPALSDETTSEDDTSPRTTANVLGAAGLGVGAVLLGHTIYIAAQGGDSISEPQVDTERKTAGRPLRSCGSGPADAGRVIAVVGNRSIDLMATRTGHDLVVEPRRAAATLCADSSDANRTAALYYVSAANESLRVEIGRYPLRRCVAVTAGHKKLTAAENALANAKDAATVIWAIQSLDAADELVRSLPADEPERAVMIARVADLNQKAGLRAQQIVAQVVAEARKALQTDLSKAIQPTAVALDVANRTPQAAESWKTLYTDFAERAKTLGLAGYASTQALLEADDLTKSCVALGKPCPPGITSGVARSALAPVLQTSSALVDQSTAELSAATAAFTKDVNEKTVARADAAHESARAVRETCSLPSHIVPVDQRCTAFSEADRQFSAALSVHERRVSEIRVAAAEAEKKRRTERAAKAWRKHFSDCRRLRTAIQQLNSLSECSGPCQQVRTKMRAEYERQNAFSVDDAVEDPAVQQKLKRECEQAGCAVCP